MVHLIESQDTEVSTNAEITIRVCLSDMEQVVIDDEISGRYDSNTGQYTKEKRKFKVTQLDYEFDLNTNIWRSGDFATKDVLRLKGMAGYFFRKGDKKVGTRLTTTWYGLTDEQIAQIPDKLHDYARQQLANVLKEKLERVIDKGVVIEGKLNA